MRWLKTSTLPACLLSAAAASTLINPFDLSAQSGPARPTSPRPLTAAAAPTTVTVSQTATAPQTVTQAAATSSESEVQKELRRLYEENNREMPELQQQIRTQRVQPLSSLNPGPAGGAAASPQKTASRNPVTSFFRRLIPGGEPKAPPTPPVPPSPPAVPAPGVDTATAPVIQPGNPQVPANPAAPYSGQQPRRLQSSEVVTTPAPATMSAPVAPQAPATAAQLPLPPAPQSFTAPPTAAVARPAVTASTAPAPAIQPAPAQPLPAAVQSLPATGQGRMPASGQTAAAPALSKPVDDFQPFDDEVFTPPVAPAPPVAAAPAMPAAPVTPVAPPVAVAPLVAAPVLPVDPEFAPPVLLEQAPVTTGTEVFQAPVQTQVMREPAAPPETVRELPPVPQPAAPEIAAPQTAAVEAAFPDPFPEMSEEEADDEFEVDLSSPFVGIPLDDEPDFGTAAMPEADQPAAKLAVKQPQAAPLEETDPFFELDTAPAVSAAKTPAAEPVTAPAMPPDRVAALPLPAPELPQLTENDRDVPRAMPVEPTLPAPALSLTEEPAAAPAPLAAAETGDAAPRLALPEPMPALELELPAPAESMQEIAANPTPAAAAPQPLPQSEARPQQIVAKPVIHQPEETTAARMAMIRDRGGMKGLKGFCPVALRDQRELLDAQPEFTAAFRGQKFHFSSDEARKKFEADPARYVPAAYGADVVVLIRDKDVAEGTLDYAAWYKGKLYLFASEENHRTFVTEPASYSAPVGIE